MSGRSQKPITRLPNESSRRPGMAPLPSSAIHPRVAINAVEGRRLIEVAEGRWQHLGYTQRYAVDYRKPLDVL